VAVPQRDAKLIDSSNWSSPICNHEIHLVDSIKQIPYYVFMGLALHQVEVLGFDHHFQ
jgi:hypothetical protein